MGNCAATLATYLCERTGYRNCPAAEAWLWALRDFDLVIAELLERVP